MANPMPPPGISLDENMATAFHKKNVLKAGSAFMYSWFYYSVVTTILLALCLVYIGGEWLLSPGRPQLAEVVLRVPLGGDGAVYGVKDDRGGATVPFSYRYYVYRNLKDDSEILAALRDASPFLVTSDAAAKIDVQGAAITVSVAGEVSDYHSSTLYRHANGRDYTVVSVFLNSRPEG